MLTKGGILSGSHACDKLWLWLTTFGEFSNEFAENRWIFWVGSWMKPWNFERCGLDKFKQLFFVTKFVIKKFYSLNFLVFYQNFIDEGLSFYFWNFQIFSIHWFLERFCCSRDKRRNCCTCFESKLCRDMQYRHRFYRLKILLETTSSLKNHKNIRKIKTYYCNPFCKTLRVFRPTNRKF